MASLHRHKEVTALRYLDLLPECLVFLQHSPGNGGASR